MKTYSIALVTLFMTAACGSTVDTSEGQSTAGSTTGQSVLTTGGSGSGGTGGTSGGSNSGGFVATSSEPIKPGIYTAYFKLNTDFTTCDVSACPSTLQTDYTLGYLDGGEYLISTSQDSWSVYVSHDYGYASLQWSTENQYFTTKAGCPAYIDGLILLSLNSHNFTGAYQSGWHAQACNGYAAYNCKCAWDITSSTTR